MKRNIAFFLVQLLAFSLTLVPVCAQDLSNRLPVELVRRLVQKNLWHPSLDQNQSQLALEFQAFWSGLSTPDLMDVSEVSDLLFQETGMATVGQSGKEFHIPSSNPLKVETLRFAKGYFQGAQLAKVLSVEESWIERNTKLVLDIIKMSGIPELLSVAAPFEEKIKNKELRLYDLSPEKRQELMRLMNASHGTSLTEQEGGGRYRVTGVYHDERKIFAVDFGRSIDDTLISFVHEMVHAADPVVLAHQQKYKNLYPQVIDILVKYTGIAQAAELVDRELLRHLFFEDDLRLLERAAASASEERLKKLDEKVRGKKMETKDEEIVREWLKAGIGLTLENEYRAYGLSMVLYVALKERFHYILTESRQYREFLHQFIAGDHYFVINLSVNKNPFLGLRARPFIKQWSEKDEEGQERKEIQAMVSLIDQLEYFYLQETKSFIQKMNTTFSTAIKKYQEDEDILPNWARSGGFHHPSNPYNILSARLTTSWVLRFKHYLDGMLTFFKNKNIPLINQSVGILDLSDSSLDDLVLAGVFYENSPYQNIPSDLKQALSTESIDWVDREKYFTTYKFVPELVFSDLSADERGVITSGQSVTKNLLRLKLLRSLRMFEETFPVWHSTLAATQNFIKNLEKRNYDEAITDQRAQELLQELRGGLKTASESVEEIRRLGVLLTELGHSYHLAHENQWRPISEAFYRKRQDVVLILDLMGIRSHSLQSSKQNLQVIVDDLKNQLRPWVEKCDDESDSKGGFLFFTEGDPDPKLYFWRDTGPFKLKEYAEFPLTLVCYQQNLYAVRQPGDYTNFMTTLIHKGRPISKIFMGSRFIQLEKMKVSLEEDSK